MKLNSILNDLNFLKFIELRNKSNWTQIILYKELEKFIFSYHFSKDQIFEIFEYFNFSTPEILDFLIKKFSLNYKKRIFNFNKYKNSFIIFIFIFDFLYQNDIIDAHIKLKPNSLLYDYYNFIPKVNIIKGWSKYQFNNLLYHGFSSLLSYHIRRIDNPPFFIKIGVFSLEVKNLLLNLINLKETEYKYLLVLESLILQLRIKANLSLNHIFDLLSVNIIFLIDLDFNLFWDSSKDPIILTYYANSDTYINNLNKTYSDYYNDFYCNHSLYVNALNAYIRRNNQDYEKKNKKSLSRDILNFFSLKLKQYFDFLYIFNNTTSTYSDDYIDYISSINHSNKETILYIPYYLSMQNKLIFFRKIISEYNFIVFNNKKQHLNFYKTESQNPTSIFFSEFNEEILDPEDNYLIHDFSLFNPKNLKLYQNNKQDNIKSCEKKINNLYKDDYSSFITFTIIDSFEYLNHFFFVLQNEAFSTTDICDLINYYKYKYSK